MTFKDMKIWISGDDEREAVSEFLINNGYKWVRDASISTLLRIRFDYFIAGSSGNFYVGFGDRSYFNLQKCKEYFVVDGKLCDRKPLWILHGEPVFRDTVIQWNGGTYGSTYWKDEGTILDKYCNFNMTLLAAFMESAWRQQYYRVKPEVNPVTIIERGRMKGADNLVDKVIADNPEIREIDVINTGNVRTKEEVDTERLLELLGGMQAYLQLGKKLPVEWYDEFTDIVNNGDYYAV